jgi:hypothetical protein
MVPNPAKKTAAARIRAAEQAISATEVARDAALLQLRSSAWPGRLPDQPGDQHPSRPGRGRLPVAGASQAGRGGRPGPGPARRARPGHGPPARAETKQITHAIQMAAYNAETALARARQAITPAPVTKHTR